MKREHLTSLLGPRRSTFLGGVCSGKTEFILWEFVSLIWCDWGSYWKGWMGRMDELRMKAEVSVSFRGWAGCLGVAPEAGESMTVVLKGKAPLGVGSRWS